MGQRPVIVEAPQDTVPICPHCQRDLHTIWIRRQGLGFFQQKQILMCPNCRAFLGYGSVKFTG